MAHRPERGWGRDVGTAVGLLCAAAALMACPAQAMEGARSGLALCGEVIIPSLFPFFILSSLVVELGLAGQLGRALEPVMGPLFGLNGACASAVVLGLIGGYPVGAKTALGLYENGLCTRREAERLLAFCNNSGPAFVLGVVGAGIFSSARVGLLLYGLHILSALCVGVAFRLVCGRADQGGGHAGRRPVFQARHLTAAFTESVKQSLQAMLNICAFVVCFNVILRLLTVTGVLTGAGRLLRVLLGPLGMDGVWAQRLLTGALEISSGVWTLSGGGAAGPRMVMASLILGWAGLSVHCQVLSLLGGSGLSTRPYLLGKGLHALCAAGFTAAAVSLLPMEQPAWSAVTGGGAFLLSVEPGSLWMCSIGTAGGIFLLLFLLSAGKTRKKPVHTGESVL